MEINVRKEHDNRMLGRKEIVVGAWFDGKTPSREEVKEAVCKKLNMNPELFEVVKVDQSFGAKECEVTAYEYQSKEAMEKNTRKSKEAKPAEAQKPAAKEEKKEEKK